MGQLQCKILSRSAESACLQKENESRMKLCELVNVEEKVLRQKSRVQWLKSGDQNSSYFHRNVKARQTRNLIRSLIKDDGTRVHSINDVKDAAVNYYQEMLGTNDEQIQSTVPLLANILQKSFSSEVRATTGFSH